MTIIAIDPATSSPAADQAGLAVKAARLAPPVCVKG